MQFTIDLDEEWFEVLDELTDRVLTGPDNQLEEMLAKIIFVQIDMQREDAIPSTTR